MTRQTPQGAVAFGTQHLATHATPYAWDGAAHLTTSPFTTPWPLQTLQAGTHPFLGVWGKYNKGADPWSNEGVRSYMHGFYRTTLAWLKYGGGPTYHVSAVFLWDVGSWDGEFA